MFKVGQSVLGCNQWKEMKNGRFEIWEKFAYSVFYCNIKDVTIKDEIQWKIELSFQQQLFQSTLQQNSIIVNRLDQHG